MHTRAEHVGETLGGLTDGFGLQPAAASGRRARPAVRIIKLVRTIAAVFIDIIRALGPYEKSAREPMFFRVRTFASGFGASGGWIGGPARGPGRAVHQHFACSRERAQVVVEELARKPKGRSKLRQRDVPS